MGLQGTLAAMPIKQVGFEQMVLILTDDFKKSLYNSVIRLYHSEACFYNQGTEYASVSSQIFFMVSVPHLHLQTVLHFTENPQSSGYKVPKDS